MNKTKTQTQIHQWILIPFLVAAFLIFAAAKSNAQSINVSGDYSPTYDGSIPWNVSGFLEIGVHGPGSISVEGGAVVNAEFARFGVNSGSIGGGTISGAGSQFNVTIGFLDVGSQGTGLLNVQNLGFLSSESASIGSSINTTGVISIDGNGTEWHNNGDLNIGGSGNGQVLIANGGRLVSETAIMGISNDSIGLIDISGSGSIWESTDSITIGRDSSNATLNISDGGGVTSTEAQIGFLPDSHGIVNMSGNGSFWDIAGGLIVGWDSFSNGEGTVNVDGGELNVGGLMTVSRYGSVNLNGGQLNAFRIRATHHSGEFNFDGGILNVSRFDGDLEQNGGILAPGDSPGLTEIFGDFDQSFAGLIEFELAGLVRGTEYDAIDVDGNATLFGLMDINLIDGFMPEAGDTFLLVDATIHTGNAEFDFDDAVLANGLEWDTSSFATNGTISVVSAIPEPGHLGLLLIAATTVLVRRRRK